MRHEVMNIEEMDIVWNDERKQRAQSFVQLIKGLCDNTAITLQSTAVMSFSRIGHYWTF